MRSALRATLRLWQRGGHREQGRALSAGETEAGLDQVTNVVRFRVPTRVPDAALCEAARWCRDGMGQVGPDASRLLHTVAVAVGEVVIRRDEAWIVACATELAEAAAEQR